MDQYPEDVHNRSYELMFLNAVAEGDEEKIRKCAVDRKVSLEKDHQCFVCSHFSAIAYFRFCKVNINCKDAQNRVAILVACQRHSLREVTSGFSAFFATSSFGRMSARPRRTSSPDGRQEIRLSPEDTVKLLIELGADVSQAAPDIVTSMLPIHAAALNGHISPPT